MDSSVSVTGAGPGKDIVRAWFDTVINPLISGLELERIQLQRKDWTWNHWRLQLESIRPVERHLDADVVPNAIQLFRYNQDLRELADRHDAAVRELLEACVVMQSELQKDQGFIGVYREAVQEGNLNLLGMSMEQMFGRHEERENVATLVEYTINHRGHLPGHFTIHPLWNTWHERFADAMKNSKDPELDEWYRRLIAAGDNCLENVERAIGHFKERRDQLSINHDVPIVKAA